ncbi:hypothetical protein Q7C18_02710 [Nesterenkonia sp. CL21]|uniref:hypothetical protein n=1 Tax=Nesterenkonia sp. CL21 TaxID=3064894 RepID=UPI0028784E69|nr:hypothetical protein [Nesterenkonia sp. CL21]MDS2171600.1 hypothetical protein [Nesterenkonia sp. CL21]
MTDKLIKDRKTRKYLYRVSMALIPLLISFGFLNEDIAGDVALLLAAVFGFGAPGLADANTGDEPDQGLGA